MTVETQQVIPLRDRHIAGALSLSTEAGWNQIEADWRLMMAAGRAVGIEDGEGRLAASAIAIPYGKSHGWVSMVLVTGTWQNQGLAKRLLGDCCQYLQSAGLIPVVDATPAGEAIYRSVGFTGQFGFQRWEHGAAERIKPNHINSGLLEPVQIPTIAALDGQAFGCDRQPVLEDLAHRSAGFSCQMPTGDGYLLGRDGRVASQIGPIVATAPQDAMAMLDHALTKVRGRVFVDACDGQPEFIDRLKAYGFKPQRPFLRMVKGDGARLDRRAQMFAMAGPELG